ncbi:MAG: biotin transporter BioY [Lachnospiraceae bacterium]|nr:biotin transporter BioY [Lachnospiraceae bacterium]
MNNNVRFMTSAALMAALMCILCPVSLPIGPVPVSLSLLVINLAIMIIGAKGALASYIVYLLLGMAGLPVFSGFTGGVAKLAGPTGGYLVGFVFMIPIVGLIIDKVNDKVVTCALALAVGTAVAYVFGTVWFVIMMQTDIWYALTVCVFPFIPFDIAKIVIAVYLGKAVRGRLVKASLAPGMEK